MNKFEKACEIILEVCDEIDCYDCIYFNNNKDCIRDNIRYYYAMKSAYDIERLEKNEKI